MVFRFDDVFFLQNVLFSNLNDASTKTITNTKMMIIRLKYTRCQ